jgi:hypothetical protein
LTDKRFSCRINKQLGTSREAELFNEGFEGFVLKKPAKSSAADNILFGFYLATFSGATNQFFNTRNSTAQNETVEKRGRR